MSGFWMAYIYANPVNFVFVWVPVTRDKVVKVQEPLPNPIYIWAFWYLWTQTIQKPDILVRFSNVVDIRLVTWLDWAGLFNI